MARLTEQETRTAIVPADARRRLLEHRMEAAKERLLRDIGQASSLVKGFASTARRGLWTAAITLGGLFVVGTLGVVSAIAVRRKRHRRMVRVRWR